MHVLRPGAASLERRPLREPTGDRVDRSGYGLHQGPTGAVWAAAHHERSGWTLYRFDRDPGGGIRERAVPLGAVLPRATPVQAILEDGHGDVWLGTAGGGLVVVDGGGRAPPRRLVHDPDDPSGVPSDVVQALHQDRTGRVWVGTRGGGLSRYDRDRATFRHWRRADGLPNDVVYAIEEDDRGFLWLSTNQGLARFDPRTGEVVGYDASDGLQGNEFNRWASERLPGGTLVFGGLDGLSLLDPGALASNPVPPTVALRDLRVRNQPLPDGPLAGALPALALAHDQNVLSFDLVALHFANPTRNRLRYRLEGLEEEWTDASPRTLARYANLAPGHYTFRAEGANSDGVWSQDALAVPVVIRPPFWRTWWFVLLAASVLSAAGVAAHRARLARAVAEERIRTRIARDLHDDVSATLSGIAYFARALQGGGRESAPASGKGYLQLIVDSSGEARDRISDIVWAISPEHDAWPAVLSRLRRHASDLLTSRGITYDIRMPETLRLRVLGAEARQQLWLFYKEALTNVVRHARASTVEIRLTERAGTLTLVIADDGVGFDPAAAGAGHGLGNLEARAARLGGKATVDTGPGRGTRWTLTFGVRR